jgi:hypothetical protein
MQTKKFFITHSWYDNDFTRRLYEDLCAEGRSFPMRFYQGGQFAEIMGVNLRYLYSNPFYLAQVIWCWEEVLLLFHLVILAIVAGVLALWPCNK